MFDKSEIILCDNCDGTGFKVHAELVNHHKGEYEYTPYECKACEGSGRRVKTVTTSYKPYKHIHA